MLNILKFRSSKPSYNGYAVVTGAGSGIGRSFALELAKRNTAVVCADLKLESAEETAAMIEEALILIGDEHAGELRIDVRGARLQPP